MSLVTRSSFNFCFSFDLYDLLDTMPQHWSLYIFSLLIIHFKAISLCQQHSTLFLRTVKASTSSELYINYCSLFALVMSLLVWFFLSLWIVFPQVLQILEGAFYTQAFFYLTLLPHILVKIYFYQGFPESQQFDLKICRASWGSKHSSSRTVCLNHRTIRKLYYRTQIYLN